MTLSLGNKHKYSHYGQNSISFIRNEAMQRARDKEEEEYNTVYLSKVSFVDKGEESFVSFLNDTPSINKVCLFKIKHTASIGLFLTALFKSSLYVTNVELYDVCLLYSQLVPVFSALTLNKTVRAFSLVRANLSPKSVTALATALEGNRGLRGLYLQDARDIRDIVLALVSNKYLKELILSYTNLGDSTFGDLVSALLVNQSVTKLVLNHCEITSMSGPLLGLLLNRATRLESLDLSSNNLGPKAALTVAECLKTNATLQELILCHCSLNKSGVEAIMQSLSRSDARLTRLTLSSNTYYHNFNFNFADNFINEHVVINLLKANNALAFVMPTFVFTPTVRYFNNLLEACCFNPVIEEIGTINDTPIYRELQQVFSRNKTNKERKATSLAQASFDFYNDNLLQAHERMSKQRRLV